MNLLIVDDEPLIHVSIEYSLKEIRAEDITIYHAYNGEEMLNRMDEVPMDIALVDIRMPGTNGLEAIDAARNLWPQTFYYIMSGFSEFEYAREAIRLSVTEYLLKPLEPEVLARVITRVKHEKANRESQVRDAFRSWLEGSLHKHDVNYLYAKQYYTALLLLTYDNNRDDTLFWVPGFVHKYHDYFLSLPCKEGVLLMAYTPNSKRLYEILNKLPKKDYPEGVSLFVSSVCCDPDKMTLQLHQMLDQSPLRVFHGTGIRYDLALLPSATPEELAYANQWIALRDTYFNNQYTAYVSQSSRLINQIREHWPIPHAKHLIRFITAMTGHTFSDLPSAEELASCLIQAGESLLQQHKNVDKIDAVLAYIEENFCQNISIASLSAQFDLTPNYLSTLIKNRLGIKFTDYLTGLRIAHAKTLLLTTKQSVKEITEQVGYYSQSHFTKIFIDKEGCTPAEYRNRGAK